MARLHNPRARKEYTCGRCGNPINPGDKYFWWKFRFGPKRKRCSNCRPRPSELTGSDYKSRTLAAFEQLGDVLDADKYDPELADGDFSGDLIDALNTAADELDEVAQEMEESAENMPDQFHDTSDAHMYLTEVSEGLFEAADELRDLESEDFGNVDELRDRIGDIEGNIPL